jgi:hypothetical protein
MWKGMFKAAVALGSGLVATAGGGMFVALYDWPAVMSNGTIIVLLLAPVVVGFAVGVAVYRIVGR